MSRIAAVSALGQQIWLDNLSRQLIESGELARWISEDAVAGVTSNPAIFYNAIRTDPAYQTAVATLKGLPAETPTATSNSSSSPAKPA